MSTETEQGHVGVLQTSLLYTNRTAAHELPPPEETWVWRDVDIPNPLLTRFAANDLITKVERADPQCTRHYWQTPRHIHAYIQANLSEATTPPCGNTGIHNLNGEQFTCGNTECDCRFGRETASEVLGQ